MQSTTGVKPPPPFKLEMPNPGPARLGQSRPTSSALELPSPSRRGTVIPTSETSISREERVKSPERGVFGYEGPGSKKLQLEVSRIEERGIQQSRVKVEQQTKRPQRRHIRGLYANYPTLLYR